MGIFTVCKNCGHTTEDHVGVGCVYSSSPYQKCGCRAFDPTQLEDKTALPQIFPPGLMRFCDQRQQIGVDIDLATLQEAIGVLGEKSLGCAKAAQEAYNRIVSLLKGEWKE